MICTLCYESNSNDGLIFVAGEEGKQLRVSSILYKYFRFCFDEEPSSGGVCRKCWLKVDLFHEFYVRIEGIHESMHQNDTIFVEPIQEAVKLDAIVAKTDIDEEITVKNEVGQVITDIVKNDNSNHSFAGKHSFADDNDDPDDADFRWDDDEDFAPMEIKTEKEPAKQSKSKGKTKKTKQKKYYWEKINVENVEKVKKEYKKPEAKKFKSHECDTCHQYFLTEQKLERHQKLTHLALPFRCLHYQCVQSFETVELLQQHKEQNHARTACLQCGKLITVVHMDKHIKAVHEANQCVVCDLCGKVSRDKFSHKSHIQLEHSGAPTKLQCDICKVWFKNKDTLRSHITLIHIQEPQVCLICGKVSTNSKALRKHKKIHVEGSKDRFKCIVCGKGFRDKTKLKEHSYIHTGVTDAYVCNFCGKTFRFGSSWSAHRKKEHPIEMASISFSK